MCATVKLGSVVTDVSPVADVTRLRVLAAAAAASLTLGAMAVGAAAPAWADGSGSTGAGASGSGSTSGSTASALQVQAQELAAQIQADGRRLDQMAEAVNAAEIRSQQLDGQLAALQEQAALTDGKATAARLALKQQAVMSYVVGGSSVLDSLPASAGVDRSLAISYAEILTGTQKRAVDAYHSALADQAAAVLQIGAAKRDAAVTLQQLEADRSGAAQADTERRQALTQVSGQLAVLVAQVQAAQEAAARAAILSKPPSANPPDSNYTPPPTSAPPSVATNKPTTTSPPSHRAPSSSTTVRSSSTTTASSSGSGSPSGSHGTPNPSPPSSYVGPGQAPGASKAIAYAKAQLGKPYQWGGAGPDSFDCSGLTMMAWRQAGVYFPHLAQDQYDMTQRVSIAEAIPGDLIFFGTPNNVFHVGLYIGNGEMIDAPETGETVSVQSIYWSDLLGAGRVTG